jgi:uncharacterized protein (DUF58 family)
MNSKGWTLALVVFCLLFTALATLNGTLAWMAVPFLAYLGLGLLESPPLGKIHLRATRSAASSQAGELTRVEVSVTVSNQGPAIDRLTLSDPLQPGMQILDGQREKVISLEEGESTTLNYVFQAGRGRYAWEAVEAAVSDPFGLLETTLEIPAAEEVRVEPELRKFRPFMVRPQRTLHSAGSIPARRGGSGTDFWGVREYYPGDPLRHLDWRLTARHPHQFFTKEFEQEEITDIGLILDARRKTDLQAGDDSLFEHSARATASLAEVFLRQGNRVSLLIYGKTSISVYPGYGKVQLHRILRALAQTTTESNNSLDSLQFVPIQLFTSHSLIVILSPLAPNDWQLFPRLRAYRYQVLLISPDPIDYARRMLPNDPATRLASRMARLERHLEISRITQLWIPVIDWKVNHPLAPLVRSTFTSAHIQQQR